MVVGEEMDEKMIFSYLCKSFSDSMVRLTEMAHSGESVLFRKYKKLQQVMRRFSTRSYAEIVCKMY